VSAADCRHPGCGCRAEGSGGPPGFCSAYCANAVESAPEGLPDTEGSACSCGHPACTESQKTSRATPQAGVSIGPPGGRPGGKGS
jgi:hypothetical protein